MLDQAQPVHFRHLNIADEQVGVVGCNDRARGLAVFGFDDVTSQRVEGAFKPISRGRVVIDDQNFVLHQFAPGS